MASSQQQTESSRLAPPSHFDIEMNEKAELEGSRGDYDSFLNQQQRQQPSSSSSRSGVSSSASSMTAFDPNTSANREKAYHSDSDDDYNDAKEFSSSTPFLSHGDDEESAPAVPKKAGPEHVTWMSLPHKGQLMILFLCRFVDFLQVATLQAYIFYQLKHMAEQQMLEDDGTG